MLERQEDKSGVFQTELNGYRDRLVSFRGGGLVPTLYIESHLSEVAEWLQR